MITTCIHTVLIYLFLLVVVRLMGKRQIGELQASEFIITILLSEIASAPITTEQFPLLHGIVSVLILVALEFLISSALLRFNGLKKFFYGAPSVVINKGKIDMREMRQNRMEIDELMSELRQKGFSDPADVYYAILEENGKLSVFPTADKAPATPADLRLTPDEHGIAHACILDGQVIPKNLTLLFALSAAALLFLLLLASRRLKLLPTLTLTGGTAALAGGCMTLAPRLLAGQKNALLVDLSMPESTLDILYRPLMAQITANGRLLLFAGLALAAVAGLLWFLTASVRRAREQEAERARRFAEVSEEG